MSDCERRRSGHHNRESSWCRSKYRDSSRTPESDLQREVQAMRARLKVLEEQTSLARSRHAAPPECGALPPPPAACLAPDDTDAAAPCQLCVGLHRSAQPPRSRTLPLLSALSLSPSEPRASHTAESLLEHAGTASDITESHSRRDSINH